MSIFTRFGWIKRNHILSQQGNNFLQAPWAGGVILIVCVVVAMLLANLPATTELYHHLLHLELGLSFGGKLFPEAMTLEKFVNDGLMVVFFFTVGLEIRREMSDGELSTPKKAILPIVAALGGMLAPALIYTLFNGGSAVANGWGIPTATDIAFAIGIMSMLGDRVPVSLKIFLTALAIADDLGAILVVAFFYGGAIDLILLLVAFGVLFLVFLLNKAGVKRMIYYLIPAIAVWMLFYYAGIHATMSGVVMAMMIPMKARYSRSYFDKKTAHYQDMIVKLKDGEETPNHEQQVCLNSIGNVARGSVGMSYRLEHALTPWVNFVIMPIFAIANAGVVIPDLSYLNFFQYSPELGSVGLGIYLGLLLGKPIGITLASWIAIKLKVGEMPSGGTWKTLFAVACLGGIGFTMSIFVDTLSFGELAPEVTMHLRNLGKIAILAASISAGVLGSVLITLFSKKK